MSLDICKKDNIFCNMSSSNYFVKIVYNRLLQDHNYLQSIKKLDDLNKSILGNINKEETVTEIFNQIHNLYISPPNIEQHKFIFIPEVNEEIRIELKKIESTKTYNSVNLDLLQKYFNFQKIEELKNNIGELDKFSKIYFIEFFINKHENINFLFNIIGHYLNKNSENDIFDSEGIFVYGNNNNTKKEIENIKQKIVTDYKKKDSIFNISLLKNILINYLIPSDIIEAILVKYNYDIIYITDIINEFVINKYLEKYVKFKPIGYSYTIRNKMAYPVDSYIFNYFDKENTFYSQDISAGQINLQDNNKLYTLEYDNDSENNIYYVYNAKNILLNLEQNNLINENVTTETLEPMYNHFIKKHFSSLKLGKLLELRELTTLSGQYKDNYDKHEDILKKYSIVSNSFNKYNETNKTGAIILNYTKNYIINITHKIVLPNLFDLRNIFNELKLSEEIPFVKYRDRSGPSDIVYKFYKPLIKKKTYKYKPVLSKDTLINWIKYKGYEFNEGEIKSIKNNPKELSYKLRIDNIKLNTKFKGEIFKINSDSVDIDDGNNIIENIPKNYVEDPIIIGNEVNFYKYRTIYADIDISRKGYLTCIINTTDFSNNEFLDIINIIHTKVNNFIEKMYLIESLQSYRIFNNEIIKNELYNFTKSNRTKISNLIYEYNLRIPDGVKIIYDDLYRISKILYPYILINEEPFNKDDSIQYYDNTKKDWINGKIVKYDTNNTYTISLFDPEKGVTTTHSVDNVDFTSLRPSDSVSSKRMFELIFKKIPDFNQSPPITNMIIKLSNSGLNESEIVERIMYNFNISKTEAASIISNILVGSSVVSVDKLIEKLNPELGISIKIDYIPQLLSDKDINIYIENISSFEQATDIYKFINYFFDMYLVIIKEYDLPIFKSIQSFVKTSKDIEKQDEVTKELLEPETTKNLGDDVDLSALCDFDDLDCLADLEDLDPDAVVMGKLTEDSKEELLALHNKRVMTEIEKGSTQAYGKQTKNRILTKLYDTDPELFNWVLKDTTKDNAYARQCQAGRQPHILTNDEKEKIDKKNEYAYASTKQDIDCRDKTALKGLLNPDTDPQCKALYYGTTDENKRWYICPRIIDLSENLPLTWKDLEYTPIDGKVFESLDDEHPTLWRMDKSTTSIEWNGDKTKRIEIIKAGKDILDFNPTYKGKTLVGDSGIVTPKASLLIMSKSETRSYPGFLNPGAHPDNLPQLCCFDKKSRRVREVFGDKDSKSKLDENNYIQSWGRQLDKNRLGLLPNIIYKYLEDIDDAATGNIMQSKHKSWFLRRGITQDNDSFLNLIANYNETTADHIKSRILTNLTIRKYKDINKGNLSVEFQNMGKQSSFQNFLEYTISDQYKIYKYFYELLVNTAGFGFDKTNNILLILEYTRIDGKDNIDLLCPYFSNKTVEDKGEPIRVYLAIKYGNVFEPIYKYSGSQTIDRFLLSSDKHINKLVDIFNEKCSMSESKLIDVAQKYGKITYKNRVSINEIFDELKRISEIYSQYQPIVLIRDNYNKVVGIFLKNKTIIPVYPQNIEKTIGIDTVGAHINRYKQNPPLNTIIETYNTLKTLSKNIIDISIIKLFENDNKITGYVTNTGVYIPIDPFDVTEDLNKYDIIKTNYQEVDKKIKEYQQEYNKLIYKEPLSFEETNEILNKLGTSYPKFQINSFITWDGKTSNILLLKCDLYIEITYTNIEELSAYNKLSGLKKIDDLINSYLTNSIELSRISDYKLPCLPVKCLMNDNKVYYGVILETGLEIPITNFNINDKEGTRYKISHVIENPIIDKLFGETILDKNIFEDDRIRSIEKQRYLSDIFEIIKLELYIFFQNPKYNNVKQLFVLILDHLGLTSSQKRRILYPIFDIIFQSICTPLHISDNKYPKLNVMETCNNSDCKLENCTTENTNYEKISKFNEYLVKLYVLLYKKSIEEETPEFNQIIENISIIEKNHLEKTLAIYNDLVDTLNSESSLCKTQIIENLEKTRINTFQNKILEEIIRNKYKRNHILNRFKRTISKERYKIHEPYEMVILSDDINATVINDLYNISQKKYYSDILPFDDTVLDISMDLDTNMYSESIKNIYSDTCEIKRKTITNINLTGRTKPNMNASTIHNITRLNSDKHKELFDKIMNINVLLDSCEINNKNKKIYTITILDKHKKLR